MVKKITFVVLIFSLFGLARESFLTRQETYVVSPPSQEGKTVSGDRSVQKVKFYPSPPKELPDLAEDYIFNAERHLVTEKDKEEAEKDEVKKEMQGPEIDMEALVYSGSIIMGDRRKALVSYKEKVNEQDRSRTPFPGRREPEQVKAGDRQFALLGVSETLGQYEVIAVEPDRIVFQKNGESVTKLLYEQSINRIITPSVPEKEQERAVRRRVESEQKDDKEERRTVIFSSRPGGDNESPQSEKDDHQRNERQIRIPFR